MIRTADQCDRRRIQHRGRGKRNVFRGLRQGIHSLPVILGKTRQAGLRYGLYADGISGVKKAGGPGERCSRPGEERKQKKDNEKPDEMVPLRWNRQRIKLTEGSEVFYNISECQKLIPGCDEFRDYWN